MRQVADKKTQSPIDIHNRKLDQYLNDNQTDTPLKQMKIVPNMVSGSLCIIAFVAAVVIVKSEP